MTASKANCTEEVTLKIKFFSELYVETVKRAVNENKMDGLTAGRIALTILGCPEKVIDFMEKEMIKNLNN